MKRVKIPLQISPTELEQLNQLSTMLLSEDREVVRLTITAIKALPFYQNQIKPKCDWVTDKRQNFAKGRLNIAATLSRYKYNYEIDNIISMINTFITDQEITRITKK